MIEIVRYLLAAVVAQTHLWSGSIGWTGHIAVFAFYTLSGYLITRVLHFTYGYTWSGTRAFVINRILRLWPAYLVILTGTLIAAKFLPLDHYYFLIRTPRSPADIVTNLAILGQVTFDFRQWLPLAKPLVTSWSLSIEVFCYLLLCLYFGRSLLRLYCFAILGVVAIGLSMGWCHLSADPSAYGPYCFQNRYGVLQAGFLPFAIGGIYFFKQKELSAWIRKYILILLSVLGVPVAAMLSGYLPSTIIAPYLGIPLTCIILSVAEDGRRSTVCDFFGRASYHLFISHMPAAAILVTGLHVPVNSFLLYAGAISIGLLLSAFLVPLEWRVNRMRRLLAASVVEKAPAVRQDHNPIGRPAAGAAVQS